MLHYHFRPGGVRRVIELGLPALARAAGCTRVTLASGEAPPPDWREFMEAALYPCRAEWFVKPAFGYWSEQSQSVTEMRAAIRDALRRLARPGVSLWAHNLSVGRNMLLAGEVAGLPESVPLWLHHHDWWWDGRWERWPEMQAQGFTTLMAAVEATLPRREQVRNFVINLADCRRMRDWSGGGFQFLPNPLTRGAVTAEDKARAGAFLRKVTGSDSWWLYPCRGLRRKNPAEALLVQRWLAPGAVTVTTGGASSAGERAFFEKLTAAAREHQWPLHAGVCETQGALPVPALMAAADQVILTSLREGFGLPYFEAALGGRPALARIPNGLDDTLFQLGVPLAAQWHSIPVPEEFYDAGREEAAAAEGGNRLLDLLPEELRAAAETMPLAPGTRDFGALSLEGQLEVLTFSPERTRSLWQAPPVSGRREVFDYVFTPGRWAREFLAGSHSGAAKANNAERTVRALTPLLHHWLSRPLLWPD